MVKCVKMKCNSPNLDLVNMNAHIKFGEIMSICSQDIERETKFWQKSRAITLVQKFGKMTCNNPILGLVNMNTYIKFCEIMSICYQDNKRKQFFLLK